MLTRCNNENGCTHGRRHGFESGGQSG